MDTIRSGTLPLNIDTSEYDMDLIMIWGSVQIYLTGFCRLRPLLGLVGSIHVVGTPEILIWRQCSNLGSIDSISVPSKDW